MKQATHVGAIAFAAAFSLGIPAHAAETVLFTSGGWVVKRVTDPRGSFCGVSSTQNPYAQLATPQRLVFPLGGDILGQVFVKMAVLPVPVARTVTPQERAAKALYIEGPELAQLMQGSTLQFAITGLPQLSIDGKGLKSAADNAQAKCAAQPAAPITPDQVNALNAQVQAKVDQLKATANGISGPAPGTPPSAPPAPTPALKDGPVTRMPSTPTAAPPSVTPPAGSIGAGLNPANLSPEAKQLLAEQAAQQAAANTIVNTLCPATVVSRMQAMQLTNAQITQICR